MLSGFNSLQERNITNSGDRSNFSLNFVEEFRANCKHTNAASPFDSLRNDSKYLNVKSAINIEDGHQKDL